ncbi:olfactory receptor 52N1-like [Sardina pilchardus]|uniref:olfactory receptor 52N1-like n=1 Tax=Sardina pilchardus TaxID=27697 RepID=UPI002E0D6AE3
MSGSDSVSTAGQGTRMENMSTVSDILVLEELGHPESFADVVFYTLLFVYITLLITNFGVLVIIIREKSLHQPMYLLYCNLSVNDILGNTVILPQLLFDMVTKNRLISYNACASQIFFTHTFASASHTILIIMAIDSVLVGLTIRLSHCRSLVPNFYCDNASLFKLSCEDVSINNIYGLFYTVVILSSSMGTVAVTYIRIGVTCLTKKNAELNSKAIQTCASHLVLYLILLFSGFIIVIMHRFPDSRFLRKLMAILFLTVPANLNPIIYGLQTKHLRLKILQIFKRKITPEDHAIVNHRNN